MGGAMGENANHLRSRGILMPIPPSAKISVPFGLPPNRSRSFSRGLVVRPLSRPSAICIGFSRLTDTAIRFEGIIAPVSSVSKTDRIYVPVFLPLWPRRGVVPRTLRRIWLGTSIWPSLTKSRLPRFASIVMFLPLTAVGCPFTTTHSRCSFRGVGALFFVILPSQNLSQDP